MTPPSICSSTMQRIDDVAAIDRGDDAVDLDLALRLTVTSATWPTTEP